MIHIANPIYDSVFKYLMEDERIAKIIHHHGAKQYYHWAKWFAKKDGKKYAGQIGNKKFYKIMLGNYGGKHHMDTDENLINTIKELSKKYFTIDEE